MNLKQIAPWAVAAVIFAGFPLAVQSPYTLQYGITMLLYAFLATAWNIIGGYAGQMALGNIVYFGIGCYVTAVLFIYEGLSPWISMLVGGAIAAVIQLFLGMLTFRLSGSYFALATVALLNVARLFINSTEVLLGYEIKGAIGLYLPWRGESFWNMQFGGKVEYYYIALALFVLGLLVSRYIKNSKTGYYLRAISTNQEAASSLGVNVTGTKLRAACIAAFLTAMGGSFYAMFIAVVDPSRVFGYDLSVQVMMYAIIGGSGTLLGPVFGAFLLSPLNDLLRAALGTAVSGLALVVYGLALMLIIYFLPKGLLPLFESLYRRAAAAVRSRPAGRQGGDA